MTVMERFETKVKQTDGCWEWTASKTHDGYGKFGLAGRMQGAHRIAYELYVGTIPEGLCVLHRCDNPGCCRPDHLFLGTKTDNARDCINKGRGADRSGGKHGMAKLTEAQVLSIRAKHNEGARNIDIAEEYGVSQNHISNVVLRRRWAHI